MHIAKKLFIILPIFVFAVCVGYFFACNRNNTVYSDSDYVTIANHFKSKKNVDREIVFLKKALSVNPYNFTVAKRLGFLYYELDDDCKAFDYFKKAYELNNKAKDCLYYIGYIAYHKMYDEQTAIKAMSEFIEYDKNNVNSYIVLHDCYMKRHEFEKARQQDDKKDALLIKKGIFQKLPKHWDGQDPRGKTILLRDNVGIGDLFCWLRYAKQLKKVGARVALHVRPYLIPILSKCPYIDELVGRDKPLPYFDYQFPVGQTPYFFVSSVNALRFDGPYMYADERLTALWKKKLAKDKSFKVGICWDPCVYKKKDGSIMKNRRAIPLSFFRPLSKVKNVSFYSLQRVNGTEQAKKSGFPLYVFGDEFDKEHGSFSDTAAVMKNLDLVITTDTSVAHLAGALGIPVWTLIPFVPDWRWTIQEGKTPMYSTMRLFRQKKLDDWEQVMSELYCEFLALVKK